MERLKNTPTQQQLDTYVHDGLKTTRWRTTRREVEEDRSALPRLICLLSIYRLTADQLILI